TITITVAGRLAIAVARRLAIAVARRLAIAVARGIAVAVPFGLGFHALGFGFGFGLGLHACGLGRSPRESVGPVVAAVVATTGERKEDQDHGQALETDHVKLPGPATRRARLRR